MHACVRVYVGVGMSLCILADARGCTCSVESFNDVQDAVGMLLMSSVVSIMFAFEDPHVVARLVVARDQLTGMQIQSVVHDEVERVRGGDGGDENLGSFASQDFWDFSAQFVWKFCGD